MGKFIYLITSSLLLITVLALINFAYNTMIINHDISYIINKKSFFSYTILYIIIISIILILILILRIIFSIFISINIFTYIDIYLIILGIIIIGIMCWVRRLPLL